MRKLKFGKKFAVIVFFMAMGVISIFSMPQVMAVSSPSITLTSPNGGETITVGDIYNIKWLSPGINSNVSISLNRITGGSGGTAYIAQNVPNTGSYEWNTLKSLIILPSSSLTSLVDGNDYSISVITTDKNYFDGSDSLFSVVKPKGIVEVSLATSTPASTTIQKGAKNFTFLRANLVAKNYDAKINSIALVLSKEGPSSGSGITRVAIYDGNILLGEAHPSASASDGDIAIFNFNLVIPKNSTKILDVKGDLSESTSAIKARVSMWGSSYIGSEVAGYPNIATDELGSADGNFMIVNQPSITVLSPNGGETWVKGTKQTIKWQDNTPVPACPAGATCATPLKSYDIKLVTPFPSCTGELACPLGVPAPYTIAKNIDASSYSWTVGAIKDLYDGLVPEGSFTIQICKTGTTTCDSSDSYFKITSAITPQQTCSTPVCDDGKLVDTGKVDTNGCKIYSCQETNAVSEQVKCVFKGSLTEQKCYIASDNNNLSCSGKETCVIDVKAAEGKKLTWKSSCGGYAYTKMDGQNESVEFNCALEIIDMKYKAKDMVDDKYDSILTELKQLRDTVKEQQNEIKYLKSMAKDLKNISNQMKSAINDFITYGVDSNTVKLGAGERAAVINSYKAAFAKLPETEAELTDVIKIANGRFPSLTSDLSEKLAKEQFIKIYKRIADLNDAKDNAAIKVMAYGLRQKAENRNLNSEKNGIKIFKAIYGYTPKTTEEWNIMQAITYSGAIRGIDTDGDLLTDDREAELGTDPNNKDTDGDGFKDGVEVMSGYNPLGEGKL